MTRKNLPRRGLALILPLSLVVLASEPARASTITYELTDSTEFYASFAGSPISLIPTTFSEIGRLPLFDPTLGQLKGASLTLSLSGTAELVGHSATPFVTFRSTVRISDEIDVRSALAGLDIDVDKYASGNPRYSVLGVAAEDDWRACALGCEAYAYPYAVSGLTIDFEAADLSHLTGSDRYLVFTRNGSQWGSPRYEHYPTLTGDFLEACIDDCGDVIGVSAFIAYVAQKNHLAFYSDAHAYGYMERRFFMTYDYEPLAGSSVPEPATPALLALAAVGFAAARRRRRRPASVEQKARA